MRAVQAAGDGDALPLAAGQVDAAELTREHGVEADLASRAKTLEEARLVEGCRGAGTLVGGGGEGGDGLRIGDADVIQQGHAVALVVLEDGGEAGERRLGGGLVRVDAADGDRARVGMVEAGDETDERALAGAVLADDGDGLTGGDGEGDGIDGILAGAGIAEADVLQGYAAVAGEGDCAARAFGRGQEVQVVAAKAGILEGKAEAIEKLIEPLEDRVHGEVDRAEEAGRDAPEDDEFDQHEQQPDDNQPG